MANAMQFNLRPLDVTVAGRACCSQLSRPISSHQRISLSVAHL